MKAAKKSRSGQQSLQATLKQAEERGPSIASLTTATVDDVNTWLQELKTRRNEEGKLVCNAQQFRMVEKIANRVKDEMLAVSANSDAGEPLRWCLHGGPGTGKSHVLELVKIGVV